MRRKAASVRIADTTHMKITLYRAADDDYVMPQTSFAEDREVAEAYLDNLGFGGEKMWTAEIEVDPATVIDFRDDRPAIVKALGLEDDPGAMSDAEILTRGDYASRVDRLTERGYAWAIVYDDYPKRESVNWIWLGSDDVEEPEMKMA